MYIREIYIYAYKKTLFELVDPEVQIAVQSCFCGVHPEQGPSSGGGELDMEHVHGSR